MKNLELVKVITPNGDIGYHFPIYDENATFEIVHLYYNKNNERMEICKMSVDACEDQSLIIGVITKCAYLEAQVPKNGINYL